MGIACGERCEFVRPVVHHAHIDALRRLAAEYLEHAPPHVALFNDKVFKKNKILCLFQLQQKLLELLLAAAEILDLAVIINGEAAALVEIGVERGGVGMRVFQCLQCGRLLREQVLRFANNAAQPVSQQPVPHVHADIYIHERAEQRRRHYQDQPCYL